ncbi:hypothetical protein ACOTVP_08700 [Aliarcobacter butzleri]
MTLQDCVNTCYENDEFVKEFNRLHGTNLKTTGNVKQDEKELKKSLKKFVQTVNILIYQPLIEKGKI